MEPLPEESKSILKKIWGYDSFRTVQEQVIQSILDGKDTLGLMPTGGGKSITFQVPALMKPGVCLVITPLIALMKDQVNRLVQLGIKAMAVFSGMSRNEIEVSLDNVLYGNYKFLYVSPERLSTELFQSRLEKMNVNLIAVDEAHCISQWGYDFRPSYLKIADIRDTLEGVPVLALTATATPEVTNDIQEKLLFKVKNIIKSSFKRENLVYLVRYIEDKTGYIIRVSKETKGSGIIYVRNRKNTREIAHLLQNNGISADYYHAGLKHDIRNKKQEEWTKGKIRIMVSTNAFGMGIDKPDVRFVIHYNVPDNIEEYFQEAGRAGRDVKKSVAVLLYNDADEVKLKKRLADNFPPVKEIKRVYQALGNYYQIPVGGGKGMAYDFNMNDFVSSFKLGVLTVYSSIKFLEKEGYIEMTDDLNNPSKVYFHISRDELYKFQIKNQKYDSFIKLLLRSYTGLFSGYTPIDELLLAKRAKLEPDDIYKYLNKLGALKILSYIPQKKTPQIIFTEERLDEKNVLISNENYKNRKKRYEKRLEGIMNYAASKNKCRSQVLLEYFGEKDSGACGHCDVCRLNEEATMNRHEYDDVRRKILLLLKEEAMDLHALVEKSGIDSEKILKTVQWLLDNNEIYYNTRKQLLLSRD